MIFVPFIGFSNLFSPLDLTNPFLISEFFNHFTNLRTAHFLKTPDICKHFSDLAFSSVWNHWIQKFSTWDSTHPFWYFYSIFRHWKFSLLKIDSTGFRLFNCTLDSPFTVYFCNLFDKGHFTVLCLRFSGSNFSSFGWLLLTVFRFTKGPLLASLALPICFDAYCQFISLLSSNTDHFKLLNLSFQNIGSLKSKHAAIEFL